MPTAKEVQRELCRREWAERIAECESSNMSVREWCAANGVNVNTFLHIMLMVDYNCYLAIAYYSVLVYCELFMYLLAINDRL